MSPTRSDSNAAWVMSFKTELGWLAMSGSQTGLNFLTFGYETESDSIDNVKCDVHVNSGPPKWAFQAKELLTQFLSGSPAELNSIPLDIRHQTKFEQKVRRTLRTIQYGQTISYGELAAEAGHPGAARAVGSVMAKNPVPLIIPCHRVLAANQKLGGYSAADGLSTKLKLLAMERA